VALADGIAGTAQHGADTGQQLPRVERLRHVVIGAELQADNPVRLLAHGSQHDDRHIGLAAQPAGEVQPRLARQHQIQNDELVVAIGPGAAAVASIPHGGDPHAVLLQEAREQIANLPVVVHHHDVRRLVHSSRE
jgi:hypothetical protein